MKYLKDVNYEKTNITNRSYFFAGCFASPDRLLPQPSDQRQLIKGEKITIVIKYDSQTGRVAEVEFNFMPDAYHYIDPMTYYEIEKALKANIRVNPTNTGRRMNFIRTNWRYEPKPPAEFSSSDY